jgi:hypothetical protein
MVTRILRAMFMTLALLGLLAMPATAQEGDTDEDEQGSLTFELKLNGEVPSDDRFAVTLQFEGGPRGGSSAGAELLCGFKPGDPSFSEDDVPPGIPECEGDEVFRGGFNPPAGTGYKYSFVRFRHGDFQEGAEVFFDGTVTVGEDTVISAWYTFGGDDQQDDTQDGDMPEEMPNTGAGGTAPARSALPVLLLALAGRVTGGALLLRRS